MAGILKRNTEERIEYAFSEISCSKCTSYTNLGTSINNKDINIKKSNNDSINEIGNLHILRSNHNSIENVTSASITSNNISCSNKNIIDDKASICSINDIRNDIDLYNEKNIYNFSPKCITKCIPLLPQLIILSLTTTFLYGYHIAVLNTSKQFIILDFKWCSNFDRTNSNESFYSCKLGTTYGTLVNTAIFIGATIGGVVSGGLIVFGRRRCIIITHSLFILGGIMSVISEGFATLFFSRIITGAGLGMSTVVTGIWISESTPKNIRGFWGTFLQLSITCGIVVSNAFGLAFGKMKDPNGASPDDCSSIFQKIWWRAMFLFALIPSMIGISLALFAYKYDTPYYLIGNKKEKVAFQLIKEINKKNRKVNAVEEVKNIEKTINDCNLYEKSVRWSDLYTNKKYFRVMIIGCILSAGQQFIGINVIISNSNLLYKAVNIESSYITLLTVMLTVVNCLVTLSALVTMDTFGRRILLLTGTTGMFLILLCGMIISFVKPVVDINYATTLQWLCIGCTYIYVVCFGFAYGPVIWVYLFEIFPLQIKKKATAVVIAINNIAAIIVVLPSDYYLSGKDSTIVFTIFTVTCGLLSVFIFFVVKETKGRSIDNSPYFENVEQLKSSHV